MIEITRDPIDVELLNREAGHPACGAVLTFSGTVRDHHLGRKVVRLAYEAYEEMAKKEMEKVALAARAKWTDLKKVQIVHRFGEMAVGDSSILPHRRHAASARGL